MIISYADKDTESFANGEFVKEFEAFERTARRKLMQLEIAGNINDLRIPPGNRLEALSGDRDGQHSLRINEQYRICFEWSDAGVKNVEIVDYHK